MREALVNRHTASSRPTPQAHEREDPITQIEELFRLDAQPFECISEFPNRLSDARPPAIDGLAGPNVCGLDVLDIASPEVQVRLLSEVERVVAAA